MYTVYLSTYPRSYLFRLTSPHDTYPPYKMTVNASPVFPDTFVGGFTQKKNARLLMGILKAYRKDQEIMEISCTQISCSSTKIVIKETLICIKYIMILDNIELI